jgi:hypothetical protein
VASLPSRNRYRRALGVTTTQRLIVVSSTWGPGGVFGGTPDLLPLMMDQLPPDQFRVVTLLHPAVWGAHGRRQIAAWTRDCQQAGMILAGPTDDWRAYVAAADVLIGDFGSVTAYAAAVGLPVLCLATCGTDRTVPHSPQSLVLGGAGRLDVTTPIRPQLCAARPVDHRRVAAAITSRPGLSGQLIRQVLYRLMGLPARGTHRGPEPVAVPGPRPGWTVR